MLLGSLGCLSCGSSVNQAVRTEAFSVASAYQAAAERLTNLGQYVLRSETTASRNLTGLTSSASLAAGTQDSLLAAYQVRLTDLQALVTEHQQLRQGFSDEHRALNAFLQEVERNTLNEASAKEQTQAFKTGLSATEEAIDRFEAKLAQAVMAYNEQVAYDARYFNAAKLSALPVPEATPTP